MRGRVIEQEDSDAVGVRLLKDRDCPLDLREELHMIPPRVATRPRIRNAPGVFLHDAILIADDKTSVLLLDKIRNVDESPPPFLHDFMIPIFIPV